MPLAVQCGHCLTLAGADKGAAGEHGGPLLVCWASQMTLTFHAASPHCVCNSAAFLLRKTIVLSSEGLLSTDKMLLSPPQ
jgi:hypothetical protein